VSVNELNHDRQLYSTLIPPSHESPAIGLQTCTCPWLTHCPYFTLELIRELTLRYTTPDIHCRHRRHECDGEITLPGRFSGLLSNRSVVCVADDGLTFKQPDLRARYLARSFNRTISRSCRKSGS